MSYRNDHDAALHRVAALESELAKLKEARQPAEQRIEPEHGGEQKLTALLVAGAAAILGVAGIVWRLTNAQHDPHVVVDEDVSVDVGVLAQPVAMDEAACTSQVEAWAIRDAQAADPRRGSPEPVTSLMRGPVACGGSSSDIPSNESSLISVYYEHDPVALDGYSTAEQLWREYHRARAKR